VQRLPSAPVVARSPALSRGRQLLAQEPGSIEFRSDAFREQLALDEIQGFMDRREVGLSWVLHRR
jgi:hypothetical protein